MIPEDLPESLVDQWTTYRSRHESKGGSNAVGIWVTRENLVGIFRWLSMRGDAESVGHTSIRLRREAVLQSLSSPVLNVGDFLMAEDGLWWPMSPEDMARLYEDHDANDLALVEPPGLQQTHPSARRSHLTLLGGTSTPEEDQTAVEAILVGGLGDGTESVLAAANHIAEELVHDGLGFEGCECSTACHRSRLVDFVDMALKLDDPRGVLAWLREDW